MSAYDDTHRDYLDAWKKIAAKNTNDLSRSKEVYACLETLAYGGKRRWWQKILPKKLPDFLDTLLYGKDRKLYRQTARDLLKNFEHRDAGSGQSGKLYYNHNALVAHIHQYIIRPYALFSEQSDPPLVIDPKGYLAGFFKFIARQFAQEKILTDERTINFLNDLEVHDTQSKQPKKIRELALTFNIFNWETFKVNSAKKWSFFKWGQADPKGKVNQYEIDEDPSVEDIFDRHWEKYGKTDPAFSDVAVQQVGYNFARGRSELRRHSRDLLAVKVTDAEPDDHHFVKIDLPQEDESTIVAVSTETRAQSPIPAVSSELPAMSVRSSMANILTPKFDQSGRHELECTEEPPTPVASAGCPQLDLALEGFYLSEYDKILKTNIQCETNLDALMLDLAKKKAGNKDVSFDHHFKEMIIEFLNLPGFEQLSLEQKQSRLYYGGSVFKHAQDYISACNSGKKKSEHQRQLEPLRVKLETFAQQYNDARIAELKQKEAQEKARIAAELAHIEEEKRKKDLFQKREAQKKKLFEEAARQGKTHILTKSVPTTALEERANKPQSRTAQVLAGVARAKSAGLRVTQQQVVGKTQSEGAKPSKTFRLFQTAKKGSQSVETDFVPAE